MKGMERQYLRECIESLCKARHAVLNLSCEEGVSKIPYGKADSFYLDAAPEVAIIKTLCEDFDTYLPLVVEEIGSSVKLRGTEDEVICFCDPMDRSNALTQFLSEYTDSIESVFKNKEAIKEWESLYGGNIELSGPYGSITAVRHNSILFSTMINYITGIIYIASDAGVGKLSSSDVFEDKEQTLLKRTGNLIDLLSPISFYGPKSFTLDEEKKFVAFFGGTGKKLERYKDNLIASRIFGNEKIEEICKRYLVYDLPGGPARILYLQDPARVGFILSNGEKIGEWLGWLAYVKYCWPKLRAYEISFDSSWTRDQILMAPGPPYSILCNNIMEERGCPYVTVELNMSKLKFLDNPSRYRATILVCPESNRKIIEVMSIKKCIELRFGEH